MVGQQLVRGTIQKTPRLTPSEPPVPPHLYASGTALKNSDWVPASPPGAVESGFVHIPPWPQCALGYSWEFLHQHLLVARGHSSPLAHPPAVLWKLPWWHQPEDMCTSLLAGDISSPADMD